MIDLSDGRALPYLPSDQAEADFSESDNDVGNDETTKTAAAPPQDPHSIKDHHTTMMTSILVMKKPLMPSVMTMML